MNAPTQVEEQITITYWKCGSPRCLTRHRTEGAASRCPARSAAIAAEKRNCPTCLGSGRVFDRELTGTNKQ